ncbi:MAG: protein kinase [Myxococcales bacterium]|nr:protein kinase [Myxococcales bacterium]
MAVSVADLRPQPGDRVDPAGHAGVFTATHEPGQTTPRPAHASALGPKLGRFIILDHLGSGTMGHVYAAYDDALDRKIAVKVLRHGGGEAALRLRREAQAMARVDHPNVVAVHEVGTEGGNVYVAMDFVRGTTLAVWQRQPGRTWSEVLEAYVQAGRGLAAAHAAGLIHRDFKPTNAIIGDDGRVRVLDFGLVWAGENRESAARDLAETRPDLSSSFERLPTRLTRDGDVVGTPAYMSSEQIRGLPLGPSTDQFSFCASLYEGLYDQLPYQGDSLGALFAAIARGRVQDPPRASRVPAWVRAVVLRGLSANPNSRWPSMDALLRALDPGTARRRRRVGLAAGLVGVAALGGFLAAKSQAASLCSGADAELAAVWSAPRRARVEQTLAAAGPAFAAEVAPRVTADLDAYAAAWKAMHHDACMTHQRGEQSDQMLDRRMACLGQRKAALGGAAEVLAEGGDKVAIEALRVVHDLPEVARCGDVAALAAGVAPPADAAAAQRVGESRETLARAEMLAAAGRVEAAHALVDAEVEADAASGYLPLEAEARLVQARLLVNFEVERENDERLTAAILTALGADMDEAAAEALALRMFLRAQHPGRSEQALADADMARALLRRLPAGDRVLGLLENNLGVVQLSRGDLDRARLAFETALEIRERSGASEQELAYTLVNLALVEPDAGDRESHLRRALELFETALGPAHPQTLDVRIAAGRYTQGPLAAAELLAPGCDAVARFSPDNLAQRSRCLADLAHHHDEAGRSREAMNLWAEADALLARARRAGEVPLSEVEQLLIQAGGATAGETVLPLQQWLTANFPEAARSDEAAIEWWRRRDRADIRLVLGLQLRGLARDAEAQSTLAAAIADYEATQGQTRDVIGQQHLARARLELAALRLEAGRPREEISPLLDASEAWYRAAGPDYAWRITRSERLRGQLPHESAP